MPNFASALRLLSTRATWKSCRPAPVVTLARCAVFVALTFANPLPAMANVEAQACSEALARPLTDSKAGLNNTLQILIWNIEKAGNAGWSADLGVLGANSDLLLIQEASVAAMIASALPQPLFQAFAAGYINSTTETGVLTLSTVEPSLHCNLTAWEPWLGTPKATNITEYPLAGLSSRLLVINLHAVNFSVGLEDFEAQVHALEPLLSQHIGPIIIAGDFNTWSNRRYQALGAFMAKHQLTPVDFAPDHRTRFWDMPLDHVFLRDLNLVESRVIEVQSSDHNPLLITVEVPQCVACTALSPEQSCAAC